MICQLKSIGFDFHHRGESWTIHTELRFSFYLNDFFSHAASYSYKIGSTQFESEDLDAIFLDLLQHTLNNDCTGLPHDFYTFLAAADSVVQIESSACKGNHITQREQQTGLVKFDKEVQPEVDNEMWQQ